ncbi:MAG TPA: HK97 gp10 family phage protein [Solirubrobacter sp.]|nr:HK97 gp10 family phage protein [Solirubrobacter sp.]
MARVSELPIGYDTVVADRVGFEFDQGRRAGELNFVVTHGLRELRRDLRQLEADAVKELRDAVKDAAEDIADWAAVYAPVKTGRMAKSIKASMVGYRAFIRSGLVYTGVQEWGGDLFSNRPGARGVRVPRHRFIGRAIHQELPGFAERLADNIDRVARRRGWT